MPKNYILESIAILLASGGTVAANNAQVLAQVQAAILKLPVEQVIEMAKALLTG